MGIKIKKDVIDVKQLVDEAATLDQQSKEIEKKLKTIKAQLADYISENFSNADMIRGVTLPGNKYIDIVTGVEKRKDADPEEVLDLLTKLKKEEKFLDLCKISVTDLTKIVGEDESKKLRPVVEIQLRQSFKALH